MTTAEIKALVDDCRSQDHIQHWHALHLLDAITTLLDRDNIKTFAEQEVRIAELQRRLEKVVASLDPGPEPNYNWPENQRQCTVSWAEWSRKRNAHVSAAAIAEGRDNG